VYSSCGKVEGGGLGGDAGGVMWCTAAVGRWREVGWVEMQVE
jgi:hypothetical protein